jgi:hypothetical protein
MKLGKGLPMSEAKVLPALEIVVLCNDGKLLPRFERNRLSRAEENRRILRVLPLGRSSIPLYPSERSRLSAAAG